MRGCAKFLKKLNWKYFENTFKNSTQSVEIKLQETLTT